MKPIDVTYKSGKPSRRTGYITTRIICNACFKEICNFSWGNGQGYRYGKVLFAEPAIEGHIHDGQEI